VKVRYGDEEDVLSADRAIMVDDEQNRAEALADLLGHFIDAGRLEIRNMATERRKHALLEWEQDGHEGLLLPYATLETLTASSSAPSPSIDELYRVLEEADILLDEHDDGPVFRREWFDDRRRMSRVKRSGRLKVHG
jgi:hypothetical protein